MNNSKSDQACISIYELGPAMAMAILGETFWPGLAAAHVLTYRTDLDGAVTFYLDGLTVSAVLAEPWCF